MSNRPALAIFGVVEHPTAELKLDEQGRRQSMDVQTTGASGIFSDPQPYFQIPWRSYSYEADGSVTIVYSDLMSDPLWQDAPARYIIPPKCLDIAAKLIDTNGNDCRYPLMDWSDPLIWWQLPISHVHGQSNDPLSHIAIAGEQLRPEPFGFAIAVCQNSPRTSGFLAEISACHSLMQIRS